MTYRILIKDPAKKAIQRLDKSIQIRIFKALKRLSVQPNIGKPLSGPLAGNFSYRVGNWRIIYTIEEKVITVTVIAVGHRREIYQAITKIRDLF